MKNSMIVLMSISLSGFAQLGLNWQEVGPDNVGGRTRVVLYDKTDPTGKTIFAGSVGGGVFKSTNGGASWTPVNDQSGVFNVSCMSQAADGSIYVGTGESFFYRNLYQYKSNAFKGTGLYKFSPNGTTFTLVKDSSLFGDINEVATHPTNAQIIYVASTKGFFISTDGGANFTQEDTIPAQDVKVGIDGHVYYASGNYTTPSSKVFKSMTGTPGSFTDITPTSTVNPNVNKMGRIEIAIGSNPDYVYLLVSKTGTASTTNGYSPMDQDLNAVYGSDDKGATWKILTLGSYGQFDIFERGTEYYGGFANTIKVNPIYPTQIFIGGYVAYTWVQDPYASFGNGVWAQLGIETFIESAAQFYLHPFIHDFAFNPNNPNEFMVATNGGIFKGIWNSINNVYNFLSANKGYNTAQFNTLAMNNFPTNVGSNTVVPVGGVVGASHSEGPLYIKGSATPSLALNAQNYTSRDAYGMEFSKINNKTAFTSYAYGSIQRNTNIYTNPFAGFTDILYSSGSSVSGASVGTPNFGGINTPLALWENWGQVPPADSTILWNKVDTLLVKVASGNTKKQFIFNYTRPQKNAYYDMVIVRTGPTRSQAITSPSYMYTIFPTYTGSAITSYSISGSGYDNSSTANHQIFLQTSLLDSVRITLNHTPANGYNDTIIMLNVALRYNAGDYVYGENKDLGIPNYVHVDSILLTAPLSYTDVPITKNIVKIPQTKAARLAVGIKGGVMLTKRGLNGDISPAWIKIAGSKSRIDAPGGIPSSTTVPVKGDVTNIQWAPSGTELYFSTYDAGTNAYYLYRVSHLGALFDTDFRDYSGVFTSDIDSAFTKISGSSVAADRTKTKLLNPIRTTAIAKFNYPITSISVSDNNQTVLVTLGGYNTTGGRVFVSNGDARLFGRNETDATNFIDKTGNLPNIPVYASLFLQQDNNKVIIGTENGVYSTMDITQSSPAWSQDNNGQLPLVPVYQLKQQTLPYWLCYNSGYIYAATHGRGIWATSKFATPYIVSVEEINHSSVKDDALFIYPNPARETTKIQFQLPEGNHSLNLTIMDITGKVISSENTKVKSTGNAMEMQITTQTLPSGIYIIQLSSDTFKKTGKLIVTQ
ncbi:MAG: hypothetical protein KatS3mg028_0630 [Bacteroidia bacterium]|nr:MAG: hypothetical protein KatS3mg028_0630 [Bacteroidia bacterium]